MHFIDPAEGMSRLDDDDITLSIVRSSSFAISINISKNNHFPPRDFKRKWLDGVD